MQNFSDPLWMQTTLEGPGVSSMIGVCSLRVVLKEETGINQRRGFCWVLESLVVVPNANPLGLRSSVSIAQPEKASSRKSCRLSRAVDKGRSITDSRRPEDVQTLTDSGAWLPKTRAVFGRLFNVADDSIPRNGIQRPKTNWWRIWELVTTG